jgi:hypothetical protein
VPTVSFGVDVSFVFFGFEAFSHNENILLPAAL